MKVQLGFYFSTIKVDSIIDPGKTKIFAGSAF